jgi:hypothetical protein
MALKHDLMMNPSFSHIIVPVFFLLILVVFVLFNVVKLYVFPFLVSRVRLLRFPRKNDVQIKSKSCSVHLVIIKTCDILIRIFVVVDNTGITSSVQIGYQK